VLTAVAGLKYDRYFKTKKGVTVKGQAHLAATYDLATTKARSVVNIGDAVYNISGESLERLGFEGGLGLGAEFGNWELSAEYDLGARKDYLSQTGLLKLKYNF